MSKHKHYEMICAKAANMDLVVFVKCGRIDKWKETETPVCFPLSAFEDIEYFLCLTKHKTAVLNLLNGGKSQVKYNFGDDKWSECNLGAGKRWAKCWWYMDDKCESRIKPRKEKRWIALCGKFSLCDSLFASKSDAEGFVAAFHPNNNESDWQFIEIEVDV